MVRSIVNSSSLLLAAVASPFAASAADEPLCLGKTHTATKLDFFNSKLTVNTLHEITNGKNNGMLKFENIGVVRDEPVDLEVTVVPGTTYSTKEFQAKNRNGKSGKFGQINMMTLKNYEDFDGEGDFNFCIKNKNDELVTVDSFRWSIFDIDERNAAWNGIKEKVLIDTEQVADFSLYPNRKESEVKLSCERSGKTPTDSDPCEPGERTVFHSSTKGTGKDNPSDPNSLTEQQKKRSVTYTFENKSCFTIAFAHYCPVEKCSWYGGGNFLFSGDAEQLFTEGECITKPPTPSPTVAPTAKPTLRPTALEIAAYAEIEDEDDVLLPPQCPEDVKLLKQYGITDFPSQTDRAVKIVSQDTSTVTVQLDQGWSATRDHSIDAIYYQFQENTFDLKCYEEKDVGADVTYDTITIECNIMTPIAHLEICIADDLGKGLLQSKDDANIPRCCHSTTPEESPVVCYTLEINCETSCIEVEADTRRLRGLGLRGMK